MKICILCREPLKTRPTNREHFVFQSTIRAFPKLGIPSKFTHALSVDECEDAIDAVLAPISAHKNWATVECHVDCNSKSSIVCQHLKYIVESVDNWNSIPQEKLSSVTNYYAHIWQLPADEVEIIRCAKTPDYDKLKVVPLYMPGFYWLGKIIIQSKKRKALCDSKEMLTIYLGTKQGLEELIGSK